MNERLEATVHGFVQGVGFRWFIVREAGRLRLLGWTANESDGSVKVVAEGSPQAVDAMLASLGRGPSGANVEGVDARRGLATGEFGSFEVRSGGHRGD